MFLINSATAPFFAVYVCQVEASAIGTVERSARSLQKRYEEREVADTEAGGDGGSF